MANSLDDDEIPELGDAFFANAKPFHDVFPHLAPKPPEGGLVGPKAPSDDEAE